MIKIGTICEGKTDLIFIQFVLAEIYGANGYELSDISPRFDATDKPGDQSNWRTVVEHLSNPRLVESLNYLDLLLIQIDTDISYEIPLDIAHFFTGTTTKKPAHQVISELKAKLLTFMPKPFNLNKIIFCIPHQSLECWILNIVNLNSPKYIACFELNCHAKLSHHFKLDNEKTPNKYKKMIKPVKKFLSKKYIHKMPSDYACFFNLLACMKNYRQILYCKAPKFIL